MHYADESLRLLRRMVLDFPDDPLVPRAQRLAEQATFSGANFIHRYLWKYKAWLNGYNGGPVRQPAMKINDGQMRRIRESLVKSGMEPEMAEAI